MSGSPVLFQQSPVASEGTELESRTSLVSVALTTNSESAHSLDTDIAQSVDTDIAQSVAVHISHDASLTTVQSDATASTVWTIRFSSWVWKNALVISVSLAFLIFALLVVIGVLLYVAESSSEALQPSVKGAIVAVMTVFALLCCCSTNWHLTLIAGYAPLAAALLLIVAKLGPNVVYSALWSDHWVQFPAYLLIAALVIVVRRDGSKGGTRVGFSVTLIIVFGILTPTLLTIVCDGTTWTEPWSPLIACAIAVDYLIIGYKLGFMEDEAWQKPVNFWFAGMEGERRTVLMSLCVLLALNTAYSIYEQLRRTLGPTSATH